MECTPIPTMLSEAGWVPYHTQFVIDPQTRIFYFIATAEQIQTARNLKTRGGDFTRDEQRLLHQVQRIELEALAAINNRVPASATAQAVPA